MFGPQDFNDMVALCSLIVAAVVCMASLYRGSREDQRDAQSMRDRLDSIRETVERSLQTINAVNAKLDAHTERIARIEERVTTLFNRIDKLEEEQMKLPSREPEWTTDLRKEQK